MTSFWLWNAAAGKIVPPISSFTGDQLPFNFERPVVLCFGVLQEAAIIKKAITEIFFIQVGFGVQSWHRILPLIFSFKVINLFSEYVPAKITAEFFERASKNAAKW